ncbi:MAG: ferrous iron transport protein B [Desulfovibrionaceae bacterium]|nr:ferrous iron transport protein B [Desulfovibrionaceae bacterium]
MEYSLHAALAGNPNSGKSTVFNALTGSRQHVGNYPGITVEKKDGVAKLAGKSIFITDLPGTYSLTAYSQEELVARRTLVEERPDVVINIIDSGALSRNLYLTVQLLEMGAPLALGLNMLDELPAKGISIDVKRLGRLLGCPATGTVARNNKGLNELLMNAQDIAEQRRGKPWEPLKISYGSDLDPVIEQMTALIEQNCFLTGKYPARWTAIKYLEADEEILALGSDENSEVAACLQEMYERVSRHLKTTLDTYPEAVIADYRYGFISSVLRNGVVTQRDELAWRASLSDKIDTVLTNTFLGPLIMGGIIYLIYKLTFLLGEAPLGYLESFFGWLGETVGGILGEGALSSLLVDGVIGGVGAVLGFAPLIMVIFMLIAILEDSGYMARMAYMLDRIFRYFGLHGNTVMPFIISGGIAGGCAVPGVMATRTLRSPKEKLASMLTAPLFACGAKLPVFLLICAVFFPQNADLVMFLITVGAWALALLVARLLRSTVLRGDATPFVMELPPYRMPTLKGVLLHMWERTWAYVRKAGTIILAVTIVIWAGLSYPKLPAEMSASYAEQRTRIEAELAADKSAMEEALAELDNQEAQDTLRHSYAGRMGVGLEPVSQYAGFDWRANLALIGGFAAKEVVVSTLGTAYSLGEVDPEDAGNLQAEIKADPSWNIAVGISFIIFVLIYAPCFPTLAVIKQEASWGWMIFATVFNTGLAFALSVIAYQLLHRILIL